MSLVTPGLVTAGIVTQGITNSDIFGSSNLVKNGGFDDGSFWNALGGWTIANEVANNDGTVGTLSQPIDLG